MTKLYRLSIHPSYSLEQAWQALDAAGIEILYGSEEERQTELFVYLFSLEPLMAFTWIIACELYTLPSIDWQAQWAVHGHNFHEGCVHIDLKKAVSPLRLQPGSGFGDLSHPTTCLMLHLLVDYLQNQIVIDIGCGSGILTLAAAAMGTPMAYGIDIDKQALEHSRQNALLNHLERQCFFFSPLEFTWHPTAKPVLILMNMIRSEQQAAWSSLTGLHSQSGDLLTSGIRVEEREIYLDQMAQWGWFLQNEQEEMGWLAFYFTNQNLCKGNSKFNLNSLI
jgi:ribosomal protein L11 methyltransferase